MGIWKLQALLTVILVVMLTMQIVHGNASKLGGIEATEYIVNNDYAVLVGNITANANAEGIITIPYPSGFNSDNCIVIANGLKVIENNGYNFEGFYNDSGDSFQSAYYRRINLKSNGIVLMIMNPNTSNVITASYKIVLMKIS